MRKVVLQMMSTLNGRLDDPDAWMLGALEDVDEEITRQYETFDTVLVGATTYKEMHEFWPGAETDPGNSETIHRLAHMMNSYKKYVFSNSEQKQELEWSNAEQVLIHNDDELIKFVNELKRQPGKDMHLSGGARLAQSFIRLGLVDEYHFYIHPTVSKGVSWFDQIDEKRDFELLSAKVYDDNLVALYYKPKSG